MAPLPADRLNAGSAFEVTGADLCGPYELKCGRRVSAKRWVVIFTCFKIRAVHFEIVETLSAPSLLNALIRFRSRFPSVRRLWSDAGTNFTGAARLLEDALISGTEKGGENLDLPIEWQRVPPHASHRAGVWERLIQSAKKILAALLGKCDTTLDVFRTVLHQAEYILNHRPITQLTADQSGFEALTPAHFLHPGMETEVKSPADPLGPVDVGDLRFAHNKSLSLIQGFWRRWSNDFVSQLRNRCKWNRDQKDIKVGQLVLLVEEMKARKDWRLARVTAVSGSDGRVRTVQIRTASGREFERDVTKIVALELD